MSDPTEDRALEAQRMNLTLDLAALEKAGKITPRDREEVEKFADYLAALKGPHPEGATMGDVYDRMYGARATTEGEDG